MYMCHYCHGYADHLDGLNSCLLNPSTGFGQEGATRGQHTFKLLLSAFCIALLPDSVRYMLYIHLR